MARAIIVSGDPISGLRFVGPFRDAARAEEVRALLRLEPGWVAELEDVEGDDVIDRRLCHDLKP